MNRELLFPNPAVGLLAALAAVGGAVLVSHAGMGAGGAYLLVVVVGTLAFSLTGRKRVIHVGIFSVIFLACCCPWRENYGGSEWLMVLVITIAGPLLTAWTVGRLKRS